MNAADARPDPDVLLRRVQEEEARAKRGHLKVFFGFAPGVGKTYRMLQVARELGTAQKLDVVVGIVETHRRKETLELTAGLEILPRRAIEYRGRTLEEFDLDAALARRPKVLLVDELAHTNTPGMRHPKRWQDVEELLDAGIDVMTTMNVQHIESLNDVIEQITRVRVRETVPDWVIDRADAIELVDIAPEELLRRLSEGKVYLPDQAKRAAEHFFQRGNLLSLRELALRRTAQHVDEDVRAYREEHGVSVTWPAGERILVCVGPSPSSGRLIRAAARMAAGLRCPWVAAYVDSTPLAAPSDEQRERLEQHLRIAESLGATVTRLSGGRVSDAILEHARKQNVTRIVIGKPTHSRIRDRLRGSLLDEVVRGSGDIDVHVISGDTLPEQAPRSRSMRAEPMRPRSYLAAVALALVTLGVALLLRATLQVPDPEMLFLLAVMLSAIWFGRGPSLATAALGVAFYDFFFVPPYLDLSVSDRRYFLTFAMMFGVGYVLSELAGRLRRQERDAITREARTAVLYALSRELASTAVPARITEVAAKAASDYFAASAVVLKVGVDGELRPVSAWPAEATIEPNDLGVARWAHDHGELAGLGTDTLPGSRCICAPLRSGGSALGVLALIPADGMGLRSEPRAFLDVFCRQVATALERAKLADEARAAALRAKTEELRASLLSTVSHDLRTPLASITGAATALRDDPNLTASTREELVTGICDQAERLERLVANLLDMTRLESGSVALRRDWMPLEEIVGSALHRLEERLSGRSVTVRMSPDLPWIYVDPVLFEQLLTNLLENADKYTPRASSIELVGRADRDRVVLEVADRGPGFPADTTEQVFEKFYRGSHAGVPGAGLGLAICRAIAEAHGGMIVAENRAGGGAVLRVSLPKGEPPAALSRAEGAPS